MSNVNDIGCSSGCKRTVKDAEEASSKGWDLLPITQRYRCPHCWRDLQAVNFPVTKEPK